MNKSSNWPQPFDCVRGADANALCCPSPVKLRSTSGLPWAVRSVEQLHIRKFAMWLLVQVVKGSKHFEPESQVGNRVLISDSCDMVISGRGMGSDGYRFEARKGNETFVLGDFPGAQAPGLLATKFTSMAQQMGAMVIGSDAT
jgi:hypothetical protein